jgi:hypothetical protein
MRGLLADRHATSGVAEVIGVLAPNREGLEGEDVRAGLTDRRLRRGVFSSVDGLVDAITTWVDHWNTNPKPFVWHAAADEILAKVRRGRHVLLQVTSATDH